MRKIYRIIFFFFQAEDGIRDFHVTGVQTCALPISGVPASAAATGRWPPLVPRRTGPAAWVWARWQTSGGNRAVSAVMQDAMSLDVLSAVESLLSDEDRMVRNTVRRFVRQRYLPRAAKLFAAEEFPTDLIPEMAEMGLLGAY